VLVNGQSVFVYTSHGFDSTSDVGIETRPVTPISFASFDFEGRVNVTVLLNSTSLGYNASVATVRPLSHGLSAILNERNVFSFDLYGPTQLSIEPDGVLQNPLHIFANPLEVDPPAAETPGVRFFGPGIHTIPQQNFTGSDQTVYVAGGAVVYLAALPPEQLNDPYDPAGTLGIQMWNVDPLFQATNTINLTIRGRGILCGRNTLPAYQRATLIATDGSDGVYIEGITLRESTNWAMNLYETDNVHVDNVKTVRILLEDSRSLRLVVDRLLGQQRRLCRFWQQRAD
jgi:hypothetical protein